MACRLFNGRIVAGMMLSGFMLAAAGCQSGDKSSALDVSGVGATTTQEGAKTAPEGKVLASELLAYCPRVQLREGTSFFNTYAKGGDGDKAKIIYQASISDVTRTCTRSNGTLTMDVAVAGRVVPGPLGAAGNVTMPIRIVVLQGTDVLYSQLHKYQLATSGSGATQFVFNDKNVSVPDTTQQTLQVFAGFDEGPPKKKPADAVADGGSF